MQMPIVYNGNISNSMEQTYLSAASFDMFIYVIRQNDAITRSTMAPVASTVYAEKV